MYSEHAVIKNHALCRTGGGAVGPEREMLSLGDGLRHAAGDCVWKGNSGQGEASSCGHAETIPGLEKGERGGGKQQSEQKKQFSELWLT